jgi:hypothetical protein
MLLPFREVPVFYDGNKSSTRRINPIDALPVGIYPGGLEFGPVVWYMNKRPHRNAWLKIKMWFIWWRTEKRENMLSADTGYTWRPR